MISLSNSHIYYKFTYSYANSQWIRNFFCKYNINYISGSFFHELTMTSLFFREFTMNSLFFREFILNSLSFLRIHYGFILFFAKSLGIPYLFHEFALISLSNTKIHNEFTTELFYDYSRINYDLTISKANSLWIYYFSRGIPIFAMSSVSNSRIHYEFTISCSYSLWSYFLLGNLLWVHYQLRKFIMNWLSLSRSHYGSIIVFSSIIVSRWIRYLFVNFNIN